MEQGVKQFAQATRLERLTEKQREALCLLADGRTSKEMARELGISVSAINQRIEMLRYRCGGISRAELGRLYRGFVQSAEMSTCKNIAGEFFHLHAALLDEDTLVSDGPSERIQLDDSSINQPELSLATDCVPKVVPRVLDGNNAGVFRGAAIVLMVVGILVALTLIIAVAHGLTEMTG